MHTRTLLAFGLLLLSACSSSYPQTHTAYGQINNDRVYGVVVSVNESESVTTHGVGQAAGSVGAQTAGAAAGGAVSGSSILSPLSGAFSSVGNMFSSNSSAGVGSESTIHYVIKKDDGSQIKIDQVPEDNEQILYPGQRCLLQANGDYLRVYPVNVEDPLYRAVPGGPRGAD